MTNGYISQISDKLQSHHIKPSYPRVKIYEYLMAEKSHPTADEIYQRLALEIPTLSKTTVYNTLDLFVKENLVRRIVIDGHESRYDATVDEHGHFVCDSCGKIYDFSMDMSSLKLTTLLDGFQIREQDLYVRGICPGCFHHK